MARQLYTLAMYDVGEFRSLGEQVFTTAKDRDMAVREIRKSYTVESSTKSRDGKWLKLTVRERRNPRPPRPSLVGSVADYFVPLGLMEQTAEGAAGDLGRISKVVRGRGLGGKSNPKPVIHVARIGRGNYHVVGMEIPNPCRGSNCSLPNPGMKFSSIGKIRQWAKGLFRGIKRSDQPKAVEVVIR